MAFALHRHFSRKHLVLLSDHRGVDSSTLATDTAFFRSATRIEDCSLDEITVFLARGIEAVMIALASNHTVSIARSIDLPQ